MCCRLHLKDVIISPMKSSQIVRKIFFFCKKYLILLQSNWLLFMWMFDLTMYVILQYNSKFIAKFIVNYKSVKVVYKKETVCLDFFSLFYFLLLFINIALKKRNQTYLKSLIKSIYPVITFTSLRYFHVWSLVGIL